MVYLNYWKIYFPLKISNAFQKIFFIQIIYFTSQYFLNFGRQLFGRKFFTLEIWTQEFRSKNFFHLFLPLEPLLLKLSYYWFDQMVNIKYWKTYFSLKINNACRKIFFIRIIYFTSQYFWINFGRKYFFYLEFGTQEFWSKIFSPLFTTYAITSKFYFFRFTKCLIYLSIKKIMFL